MVLQNAHFRIDIVLHLVVAVEVVGRDVEQHGDVGAEVVHIVELERRQLNHVVFVGFFGDLQCERMADVASQTHVVACLAENMVDEARRGCFAVGTRDTNHFRLRIAACELDFADNGNAFCDGLRHDGCRVGNARALDDFVGTENALLRVLTLFPRNSAFVEHLFVLILDVRPVRNEHVETLFLGQCCGSHTALGCA